MEIGEKLKQARLDAGLSQRQLCGDIITRNMLSQIENGSAKPSLATLQALCRRLGKPVSYFKPDAPSENAALLQKVRTADPREGWELLQEYLSPDPGLDGEYRYLSARCLLQLSARAIEEKRIGYAGTMLSQAKAFLDADSDLKRKYLLLCFRAGLSDAMALSRELPDNTEEMVLRATAALAENAPQKCLACLQAADRQTPELQMLKGDAWMALQNYAKALACFSTLEENGSKALYARMEICFRELGDYQQAYEYACKQR